MLREITDRATNPFISVTQVIALPKMTILRIRVNHLHLNQPSQRASLKCVTPQIQLHKRFKKKGYEKNDTDRDENCPPLRSTAAVLSSIIVISQSHCHAA